MDCEKNKLVQILNYKGTRDIINYYVKDTTRLDLLKFLKLQDIGNNTYQSFYYHNFQIINIEWLLSVKDYQVDECKDIYESVLWFIEILLVVCQCYRKSGNKKYREKKEFLKDCHKKIFTNFYEAMIKSYSYDYDRYEKKIRYHNMFSDIYYEAKYFGNLYKKEYKYSKYYYDKYKYYIDIDNLKRYCNLLDDIYNTKKNNKESLYNWLDKLINDLQHKKFKLISRFGFISKAKFYNIDDILD